MHAHREAMGDGGEITDLLREGAAEEAVEEGRVSKRVLDALEEGVKPAVAGGNKSSVAAVGDGGCRRPSWGCAAMSS